MESAQPPRRRLATGLLLTGLPSIALLIGAVAADTAVGLVLVLAEPLILGIGIYIVTLFILQRRWAHALSIALAVAVGAVALHRIPSDRMMLALGPDWVRPLRECSIVPKAVTAPIRILTWTVDGGETIDTTMQSLLAHRPDIVVLLGTDSPGIGDKVSTALGGEAKFFRGSAEGGGLIAVVRGSFQYCGSTEDQWVQELPGFEKGHAQAILTFPHITGAGTLPLVIARLDRPHGSVDWNWSERVAAGAIKLGEFTNTLGTRRMVVLGDFQAPGQAVSLARPLRAAGLRMANTPPNWPSILGPLPFLPQHALDQVWTGQAWHVQGARVLNHGNQVRSPILVDLTPNRLQAR